MPASIQIQTYATCDRRTFGDVLQRYCKVLERLGCNDLQLFAWFAQINWPTSEDDSFGDIYASSFELAPANRRTLTCAGIDVSLYTQPGVPSLEILPTWVGFNILFDAASLRKEHTSIYRTEVGTLLWQSMCELESTFREIGVYLTDEWQYNLAWRALAEKVGDPWAFDLAIFPREQAERFSSVPAGFQGTVVERDFGFAQENRWSPLPWLAAI
jgi:hypothetical protein